MNVAMLGEMNYERLGEVASIVFEGREYYNTELRDGSARLESALRGMGVGEGDVVAVTMSNCPQVFESFSAIFALGGVALPILFVLTPPEMRFILEDSETVAVITDTVIAPKVLEAAEGVERCGHVKVGGG